MALTLADAIINITGDDGPLDKVFDRSKKKSQGFVGGVSSFLASGLTRGLTVAVAAGTAVMGGLAYAFRDSISLAEEQRNVNRQLEAVWESMGGLAGMTTGDIRNMASELQSVTNFGDEAILTGQNILLTFGNIGAEMFPRVTEAMLDMSQAFGTDLKSSAIQLGKALNDPINGVSALTRVGVSFSEEQKEQIRLLQESGDLMGAQTIILSELENQFGGSARALADPAIQARNAWGDFKEMVGGVALTVRDELAGRALGLLNGAMERFGPILDGVSMVIGLFFDRMDLGMPIVDNVAALITQLGLVFGLSGEDARALGDAFKGIVEKGQELISAAMGIIGPILEAAGSFVSWKDVAIALGAGLAIVAAGIIGSILSFVAPILAVIAVIAVLRNAWENNWGGIRDKVTAVINFIVPLVRNAIQGIKDWWAANGDAILAKAAAVWDAVKSAIQTAIETASAIIQAVLDRIRAFWSDHGSSIIAIARWAMGQIQATIEMVTGLISGIWEAFGDLIISNAQASWDNITNIIDAAINIIGDIIDAVAAAIQGDWEAFGDAIASAADTAWNLVKDNVETSVEAFRNIVETVTEAVSGHWETAMGNVVAAVQPAIDIIDGIKSAAQAFWDFLKGKVFDFKINLPSLPSWATPGSPLPIHTAWKEFAEDMSNLEIAPRFNLPALATAGGPNITYDRRTYIDLNANYPYQERQSLVDDVQTLELLRSLG